jgi:hypothetical protein
VGNSKRDPLRHGRSSDRFWRIYGITCLDNRLLQEVVVKADGASFLKVAATGVKSKE